MTKTTPKKQTHLRAVNPTSTPVKVEVPIFRTAFASALGTIVVIAGIEGVKYLRRRSANPAEPPKKTQQQVMLAQMAAANPALLQSPLMQQIAAMHGITANPMLSPTAEPAQEEPSSQAPPWFTDYVARLTALEKPPKAKRTRKPKPRVVEEDEYEEEDEDAD